MKEMMRGSGAGAPGRTSVGFFFAVGAALMCFLRPGVTPYIHESYPPGGLAYYLLEAPPWFWPAVLVVLAGVGLRNRLRWKIEALDRILWGLFVLWGLALFAALFLSVRRWELVRFPFLIFLAGLYVAGWLLIAWIWPRRTAFAADLLSWVGLVVAAVSVLNQFVGPYFYRAESLQDSAWIVTINLLGGYFGGLLSATCFWAAWPSQKRREYLARPMPWIGSLVFLAASALLGHILLRPGTDNMGLATTYFRNGDTRPSATKPPESQAPL
jgi:hypothetical protein